MMSEEQIIKQFKLVEKHRYLPEIKTLFDIVDVMVKWEDRATLKGDIFYMSVKNNDNIPDAEKNIKSWSSYAVILKKEYAKIIKGYRCDEKDTMNLELIDWGKDGCLLIANHGQILGNHWLNIIEYKEE